jgi:hypothetical protein
MVVGNGLIASVFFDDYGNDNDFIIFAAGVSNSMETRISEFKREEDLLNTTLLENKGKHLVYFSSFIDSNPSKKKYADHKLNMENIVKNSKTYYTILKLPQVIGYGGNKHELINFIITKLKSDEEIGVYENTYKSLIDVEDVKRIVDFLLKQWHDKNTYVRFPYIEKLLVEEIVKLVAKEIGVDPKIRMISSPPNDFPELMIAPKEVLNHLNIIPVGYTEKIIRKYAKTK